MPQRFPDKSAGYAGQSGCVVCQLPECNFQAVSNREIQMLPDWLIEPDPSLHNQAGQQCGGENLRKRANLEQPCSVSESLQRIASPGGPVKILGGVIDGGDGKLYAVGKMAQRLRNTVYRCPGKVQPVDGRIRIAHAAAAGDKYEKQTVAKLSHDPDDIVGNLFKKFFHAHRYAKVSISQPAVWAPAL